MVLVNLGSFWVGTARYMSGRCKEKFRHQTLSPGPLCVLSPVLSSLNNTEMHMIWSLPSRSTVISREDRQMQKSYNEKFNMTHIAWLGSCWENTGEGFTDKDSSELGVSVWWDRRRLGKDVSGDGIRWKRVKYGVLMSWTQFHIASRLWVPWSQGRGSK